MPFTPKIILNLGFYLNGKIWRIPSQIQFYFNSNCSIFIHIRYWIWFSTSEVLITSGEFRVFLITLGVFIRNSNFVELINYVALGYSQIPGVDYMDNFSPVVADSSFRVIFLMIQKLGMEAWLLDVETDFLNGDLEAEICMHIPKGYAKVKGERQTEEMAFSLNKSIYVLVQAVRH